MWGGRVGPFGIRGLEAFTVLLKRISPVVRPGGLARSASPDARRWRGHRRTGCSTALRRRSPTRRSRRAERTRFAWYPSARVDRCGTLLGVAFVGSTWRCGAARTIASSGGAVASLMHGCRAFQVTAETLSSAIMGKFTNKRARGQASRRACEAEEATAAAPVMYELASQVARRSSQHHAESMACV